jgi:signal transduction histidine kinase
MNFYALSGLINALTATVLGAFVYLRAPGDPKHRIYGLFCLSVAVWSYFYCAWQLADTSELALLFSRLLMAGAIMAPILYLHHVLMFLGIVESHQTLLKTGYLFSAVFLAVDATPLMVSGVEPELWFPHWPKPGLVFHLFLAWFGFYACSPVYLLGVSLRQTTGLRRNQIVYVLVASLLGYAGAATNFPLWYGIPIPPDGTILITVYTALIAYTIVRYRLMDITVVFHKGVVYALILAAILLPIYVGVAVSHRATPYSIPPLLAGTLILACGLWVLLNNPRASVNKVFSLLCGAVCIWLFGFFFVYSSADPEEARIWGKSLYVGLVYIPALFNHFSRCILGMRPRRRAIVPHYLVGTAFVLLLPTDYLIGGQYTYAWGYYPGAGPLHPVFLSYFVIVALTTFYQLYRGYHAARAKAPRDAAGIKHLFWAFVIGYAASLDFAQSYGVEFYPAGYAFACLWVVIVTYIIVKHRLMDVAPFAPMAKGVSYLQALALIPSYFVILLLIRLFTGSMQFLLSGALLATFLVLAGLLANLQDLLEKAVARVLFRRRHDAYDTLTQFSKAMVTILDLRSLSEEIVDALARVIRIRTVSLYLLEKEKDLYLLASAHGLELKALEGIRLRAEDPLPRHLATTQSVLVREELDQSPQAPAMRPLLDTLWLLEAEVCIPLVNKDRLIGFCNLGPRTDHRMYSGEELNLLTTLAQNAAIALDNAALYEELKRSQTLVRRTDRLRSLETIAGGFAHEIRNPLTSIKTFIQLAPERKDDGEFMGHFSKVVSEDVDRIERLIQEILDYARYMEPKLSEEDLNDVVSSCLYFIEVKAASKSVAIEKELAPDLPSVKVDRQQIKQVLLNLLLNAMDAMGEMGGRLTVRTHRLSKANGEPWVQVEVADTGVGISAEHLEHIFDPFYTTKHESGEREGTGLGLTIVHQIVREHRGYIEVESEVGRGTTFYVNLPSNLAHDEPAHERVEHEETRTLGRR